MLSEALRRAGLALARSAQRNSGLRLGPDEAAALFDALRHDDWIIDITIAERERSHEA